MKMTEKEKGIRMELAKNETKLKAVQDRLQFLWTRGKENQERKFLTEAIGRFLPDHPKAVELKMRYAAAQKKFDKHLENHKKNSPPSYNKWDNDAAEKEKLWEEWSEKENELHDWFSSEREKIHERVDAYLEKQVGEITSAVIFLLAYHIGRAPDKDYTRLYERSGYEDNRRQIAWEKRLGISEFFADGTYSDGDRYHGYKEDAFLCAVKAVDHDLGVEYVQIPAEIERLKKNKSLLVSEIENLASFLRGYETLRRFGQDTAAVEKKMPWLIKAVADTFNLQDMQVSVDSRIAVLLSHLSFTHHGPGVEYGSLVSVYKDEKKQEIYSRFRSPDHESEDNPNNKFDTCQILSITDSEVIVRLDGRCQKIVSFFKKAN